MLKKLMAIMMVPATVGLRLSIPDTMKPNAIQVIDYKYAME